MDIDLETGRPTPFSLNVIEPNHSEYSPDGKILLIGSRRSVVRLFDAATYRDVGSMGGYMFSAGDLAISSDGHRLATGGTGSEAMNLWDFEGRERLLTIGTDASLGNVAFSADATCSPGSGATPPSPASYISGARRRGPKSKRRRRRRAVSSDAGTPSLVV